MPRSVTDDWFDVVCPRSERVYIDSDDAKAPIRWNDGKEIMDYWVALLSGDERCVEVIMGTSHTDSFPQVFDLWYVYIF